jgi:riboflavin synthase
MFTGIVECMGLIKQIKSIDSTESGGSGFSIVIENAQVVLTDVNLGDSISCNGVCLTVTEFDDQRTTFKVGVAPETIRKTNFGI